jgi:LmbE family N-acetylglucosaminyl deacetylase
MRTVVVLAAHLGEGLYAAGGLLARLTAAGAKVRVLAVTDGDGASQPDRTRQRTGAARLAVAYALLGLDPTSRYRLGLRRGMVAAAEGDVLAATSELLGFADPIGLLCLAPWSYDSHPDHAAVGRAATLACQAYRTRLLSYSITPSEHRPQQPDDRDVLDVHRAYGFQLPTALAIRKDQALALLVRPRTRRHGEAPFSGAAPGRRTPACEVFLS